MKKLLLGLSALPFLVGVATAAEPLSDRQMDWISAGDTPGVFSTSASMSTNGETVTMSTSGVTGAGSTNGASKGSTQQPSIFQSGGVFGTFNVTGAAAGTPVPSGISLPGLTPGIISAGL